MLGPSVGEVGAVETEAVVEEGDVREEGAAEMLTVFSERREVMNPVLTPPCDAANAGTPPAEADGRLGVISKGSCTGAPEAVT